MSRTLFSCLQEKVQENRGVSGLAFLPCGHGSVLVGVRSIRFDQGPRPEFLLHLLQSFVCAERLRVCRHRRASVGDGRPSACHGCAVACIGQPPPPSAPGPVLGWRAAPLSRGCGGRAFARVDGAGVMPQVPSRGCAAGWASRAESAEVAYLPPGPPAHAPALRRSIALQHVCRSHSAFVLVE